MKPRKIRVLYSIPAFHDECVGIYARFHDIIHTLEGMNDPPWDFSIIPVRRYFGKNAKQVYFRDGNPLFRYFNHLVNLNKIYTKFDVFHVIEAGLTNTAPTMLMLPGNFPVIIGPNIAVPHFRPLKQEMKRRNYFLEDMLYRLKLSRSWRDYRIMSDWLPFKKRIIRLFAFSPYHKDMLSGLGIPGKKIKVLSSGVRMDIFNKHIPPHPDIFLANGLSLLFVGNLKNWYLKGVDVFIKSLKYLDQEGINYHVWIIGGHPEQIPQELREGNREITFLGYIQRKDLAPYYRAANVLINPSRYETDGTTSVEALACGIPVIGSDIPAFVNKNHLTFKSGDPADLAAQIIRFTREKEAITANALVKAEQWDIHNAIRDLDNNYQSLF